MMQCETEFPFVLQHEIRAQIKFAHTFREIWAEKNEITQENLDAYGAQFWAGARGAVPRGKNGAPAEFRPTPPRPPYM